MINVELAVARGLSDEDIEAIKERHQFRTVTENALAMIASGQGRGVPADRWNLLRAWRANESELQKLWGFPVDSSYHKEFRIEGCSCPKEDNEQYVGTQYRYVNKSCPFHGHTARHDEDTHTATETAKGKA